MLFYVVEFIHIGRSETGTEMTIAHSELHILSASSHGNEYANPKAIVALVSVDQQNTDSALISKLG